MYEEKKVSIVGVSNDPVEKNAAFASECSFSYPLICDESLAVSVAFGAAANADAGKASRKAVLVAPDGTVTKDYGAVDARKFPEECVKALP